MPAACGMMSWDKLWNDELRQMKDVQGSGVHDEHHLAATAEYNPTRWAVALKLHHDHRRWTLASRREGCCLGIPTIVCALWSLQTLRSHKLVFAVLWCSCWCQYSHVMQCGHLCKLWTALECAYSGGCRNLWPGWVAIKRTSGQTRDCSWGAKVYHGSDSGRPCEASGAEHDSWHVWRICHLQGVHEDNTASFHQKGGCLWDVDSESLWWVSLKSSIVSE